MPDPTKDLLAQGVRGTVLRPVFALQRGTTDRAGRFENVAGLRAERDSLAAFLVGQAGLETENRRLRGLLGLRQRLPYSFVPAEVVRVQGPAYMSAFMLTVGSGDGIRTGNPIVTSSGLVGMVRNVEGRSALGIDWTHPDFRASAMTADGSTFGIVERRGGREGEEMLLLTGTAFHVQLDSGTMVLTSGRGGVYPRGIPIGTIAGAESEEGGWRRSYLVRPMVNPGEMDHVLVLGDPTQAGGDPDLAAAWGIRLNPATDTAQGAPQLPGGAVLAPPAAQPSSPSPPRPAPATPAPAAPRPAPGTRILGSPVQPANREPAARRR